MRNLRNIDVREAARTSEVKLWEVADALKIHDSGLSRRMRKELSEEEKQRILDIIERIKDS